MNAYILHIDDLAEVGTMDKWFEKLSTIYPEKIIEEIKAYKKTDDQYRVMGGRLLISHALKQEEQMEGHFLGNLSKLHETDKGRLFFDDSPFDFNISHSGKLVVLATSNDNRCGIDVEMHREVDIDMFRRLFTDGEWEAIQTADDSLALFFKCWAIKESVIKADGRGVEVISKTEIQSKKLTTCDGVEWNFKMLKIDPDYSCSIASDKIEDIIIIPVEAGQLINPS